jgi:hypothetical protein
MTDGFVSYWSDVMIKPNDPFYEFAKKMIGILYSIDLFSGELDGGTG